METSSEEYKVTPPATQARHDHNSGPHPFTNRLIDSTSPYLLQHAHNPVEWYPWGPEALNRARTENKPIFLSIGYSACHWCHVMEREVFEKHDIASIMNAHFINIKVDREERPDLDELYMLATQLMSGSGGWPMSVWLTPDLKPFYAGTYFPPTDNYGRPGFPRLELALADAWKTRRTELEAQAEKVVDAIRTHADETAASDPAKPPKIEPITWIAAGIEQFADRFDPEFGGLGSAPKFPPHQALHLWLSLLANPHQTSATDLAILRDMTTRTLDGMMNGGIYDHVGGAFARYSTDEKWLVPHFEKMLYDSAQLAPIYALASAVLGRPDYARIARETLDFFLREMTLQGGASAGAGGAFFSALDADSGGHEGLYYVWTLADVHAALPDPADAALIIKHFGMTAQGNWHESPVPGGNVLAIAKPLDTLTTADTGLKSHENLRRHVDHLLQKMRAFRTSRERPGLDDKILTAWNGLMISALAITGRTLREPRYLEAAHRTIGFLLTQHMEHGRRLLRASRRGHAHVDGFLDDHAFLLNGLMDLIDSTTATSLPGTMARKRALELADTLIADFQDKPHGGFFYTSPRHEQLFARMKNAADNATPSADGVAIRALLRLAQVSGKEHYRDVAMHAVSAFATNIARRPEYFPTILLALAEDAHASRHPTPAGLNGVLPGATFATTLPPVSSDSSILQLSITPPAAVKPGEPFELRPRITIAPGYHIQPEEPADPEAFRTVARLRGEVALAEQSWKFPPPQTLDGNLPGYQHAFEITATCTTPPTTPPGRYIMRLTLLAQPCTNTTCLPPERVTTEFTLTVT